MDSFEIRLTSIAIFHSWLLLRFLHKLEDQLVDYYSLLAVSRNSSPAQIKTAYHRALLIFHPDKHKSTSTSVDVTSIKEAYATLADPYARSTYDLKLQERPGSKGPRPAQVVSLEDFEEDTAGTAWRHNCRCGGFYEIIEEDLERGKHIVGCGSCSEVVWVGYELVQEVGADGS